MMSKLHKAGEYITRTRLLIQQGRGSYTLKETILNLPPLVGTRDVSRKKLSMTRSKPPSSTSRNSLVFSTKSGLWTHDVIKMGHRYISRLNDHWQHDQNQNLRLPKNNNQKLVQMGCKFIPTILSLHTNNCTDSSSKFSKKQFEKEGTFPCAKLAAKLLCIESHSRTTCHPKSPPPLGASPAAPPQMINLNKIKYLELIINEPINHWIWDFGFLGVFPGSFWVFGGFLNWKTHNSREICKLKHTM